MTENVTAVEDSVVERVAVRDLRIGDVVSPTQLVVKGVYSDSSTPKGKRTVIVLPAGAEKPRAVFWGAGTMISVRRPAK